MGQSGKSGFFDITRCFKCRGRCCNIPEGIVVWGGYSKVVGDDFGVFVDKQGFCGDANGVVTQGIFYSSMGVWYSMG